MMQQHVKLMQNQLQSSFQMISEKMNQLETRLIKSDEELRSQQTNLQQERQMKDQKDTENRKLFQRLQESIAI
jgi:hypothetical protein